MKTGTRAHGRRITFCKPLCVRALLLAWDNAAFRGVVLVETFYYSYMII